MIAMGSDQHFCLRWNNFHSNIATSFEHLRDHEDFVDVTLACEGRSLKAHKVVLSACSPYFRNLLKANPCQHPIIILRDVAYVDMSALLSFVYQGEVYVSQERLTTFLRTAEMLHIKGLTEQNQQQSHLAAHQLQRDQGGLVNNVVSSLGTINVQGPSSPRLRSTPSPTFTVQQPSHISPPPKKRRPATSSPTLNLPNTAPSTPPRSDVPPTRIELSPHLEGSTLAAALTKPLNSTSRGDSTPRNCQPAPPPQLPPPPLLPAPLPAPDVPKVKQEDEGEGLGVEEECHMSDQAVNLVTEGSILRQRIQGYQGTCEAPTALPAPPTSSSSNRPSQPLLHPHVKEDSICDDTSLGELGPEHGDGLGEKEALASPPPMVIRSPLVGLLPREAAGMYPGTSGSLGQHDSSQDAPARQRWRCMQPRLCPFCWKTFSNSFNLKQHIVNVHTVGEGIECELCHKVVKNKWYLRKHHVTAHGAPLRRSKGPTESRTSTTLTKQHPKMELTNDLNLALTPTSHQTDTSQPQEVFNKKQMDHAEYLVRACVPKLWNSRQPGICPICNRVFSNKFNLKQHIINIHTKGEGVECDLCHKRCKNKWYLRRHQVTHHGAPLKRNRNYSMEQYVNDENDQGTKDTTSE